MNEFKFTSNSNLVVQTDPTITFSNGTVLWLAKKGETVEINQYDWDLIMCADRYIKGIGKYGYAPSSRETVVAKAASKPWYQKFFDFFRKTS